MKPFMFLRHFLCSCGTFYVPMAPSVFLRHFFVFLRHFCVHTAILCVLVTPFMFLPPFFVFLWQFCVPTTLFCVPAALFTFLQHLFVFLWLFYVPATLFCVPDAFLFLLHFLSSCGTFYVTWRKTNNFLDALKHRTFPRFPQPPTISHKALLSPTSLFVGNVIKALCKGLQ
jgi:hypothetical protein